MATFVEYNNIDHKIKFAAQDEAAAEIAAQEYADKNNLGEVQAAQDVSEFYPKLSEQYGGVFVMRVE